MQLSFIPIHDPPVSAFQSVVVKSVLPHPIVLMHYDLASHTFQSVKNHENQRNPVTLPG